MNFKTTALFLIVLVNVNVFIHLFSDSNKKCFYFLFKWNTLSHKELAINSVSSSKAPLL